MSGIKINFGDVQGGFEALPVDTYDCIIDRVEVRESNSSDNDYLNWELSVQDEEFEGRKIWLGSSLSPNALGFLKDTLLALEVIEEDEELDIEWEDDVDITPREGPVVTNPEFEGIACRVRTVNSMWDGKERQDAWRSEIVGLSDSTPKKRSSSRSSESNGKGSKTQAKAAAKSGKSSGKSSGGSRKRSRSLR